jgi:hypothetical protein
MIHPKNIKYFYRVDWLLDDLFPVPSEEEMLYRYRERGEEQGLYVEMADFMRKNTRHLIYEIFKNSTKDFIYDDEKTIVAASPPRPYQEYIYDCAKSDIIVVGPHAMKESVLESLANEKGKAIMEKKKVSTYISQFKPAFQSLYDSGLIDGILGRGSYFAINGFPVENDNLNFMLLRKGVWSDKEIGDIIEALRHIPASYIWLIDTKYKEKLIGPGKGDKVVYFVLIDENAVAKAAFGLRYERYVMLNSPGIELYNLSKEQSESLAKQLSLLLPDHNVTFERDLPRLPSFINSPK